MKKSYLILFTLIFSFSYNLFPQNRFIVFTDKQQNPIKDVLVLKELELITISNDEGVAHLDGKIKQIRCHRVGFKDSVVNLSSVENNTIQLESITDLQEVVVRADNYDARKHLVQLRDTSHALFMQSDTIVFYDFEISLKNLKTGEVECLKGLLRVSNKLRPGWGNLHICSIDSYKHAPNRTNKRRSPNKFDHLFFYFNLNNVFKENILLDKSFRWKNLNSKKASYKRDWLINDSTLFYIGPKNSHYKVSEICFYNDKLKTFEWYFNLTEPLYVKRFKHYIMGLSTFIEYSSKNTLHPTFLRRAARYRTTDNIDYMGYITILETSSRCDCELDKIDNRYNSARSLQETVDFINKQLDNALDK